MAGETIITVVGNLTRDPELRTVGNGSTVVNFTIASSTRTFNRNTNQWDDGDTLFLNCSAWDSARTSMATNIANSLSKGMRVIAQGRLTQRSYQAQDGSQRSVVELRVDEIGPALSRCDRPGDPPDELRLQWRPAGWRLRQQRRRLPGWRRLLRWRLQRRQWWVSGRCVRSCTAGPVSAVSDPWSNDSGSSNAFGFVRHLRFRW